jgi:hypothetical protein
MLLRNKRVASAGSCQAATWPAPPTYKLQSLRNRNDGPQQTQKGTKNKIDFWERIHSISFCVFSSFLWPFHFRCMNASAVESLCTTRGPRWSSWPICATRPPRWFVFSKVINTIGPSVFENVENPRCSLQGDQHNPIFCIVSMVPSCRSTSHFPRRPVVLFSVKRFRRRTATVPRARSITNRPRSGVYQASNYEPRTKNYEPRTINAFRRSSPTQ